MKQFGMIYISEQVYQRSLLQTGDAIEAFCNRGPNPRETVFRYKQADIFLTEVRGSLYLMAKAELKRPRVPFIPVPAGAISGIIDDLEVLA